MARSQPSGSKTSKGRTDSTKAKREARGPGAKPPRAHRDDTTEAKHQREGMPKTHPGRAPVASRKSPAGRDKEKKNVQQGSGARSRAASK